MPSGEAQASACTLPCRFTPPNTTNWPRNSKATKLSREDQGSGAMRELCSQRACAYLERSTGADWPFFKGFSPLAFQICPHIAHESWSCLPPSPTPPATINLSWKTAATKLCRAGQGQDSNSVHEKPPLSEAQASCNGELPLALPPRSTTWSLGGAWPKVMLRTMSLWPPRPGHLAAGNSDHTMPSRVSQASRKRLSFSSRPARTMSLPSKATAWWLYRAPHGG
mmetsp:Transcript_43550/g.124566  ORF Transcript_43550/g.124566 Transcript_43550/m.124566 type:complete len:224 (-) Transcript_43550:165-836(-)